ncbi:MAG: TonB-dependent receptor [Burkholderiales bacterium]|nr:TonB-dependent receptor [Burkholderiales bacterium]
MTRSIATAALAAALFSPAVAPAQGSGLRNTDTAGSTLPPVVVTATPLGAELFGLASPAAVLQGPGLRLKTQSTLGEILGNEVGVASTYFGPNASRPIIRGLDGDRIQLLQNGVGVLDASAASFDHAVSLEPLLVDRVEVVRGPAALMYGGNAVGGVVNVVDGRIPREPLGRPFAGAIDLRYGSRNDERAGGVRLDAEGNGFVLHADAFGRRTDDLRIPGFQRSAQLRARDPLPPGDPEPAGRLPNSDAKASGGALGGALLFDRGYLGAAYSVYDTDYGTVAEDTVRIGLRQRRWEVAGELRDPHPSIKALRLKAGHSDYAHSELEDGEVGTVFRNRGYDGRLEVAHGRLGPLEGAIGLQLTQFDFSALGDEAYVPDTATDRLAAFVYEQAERGSWTLSFGGRLERNRVRASALVDTAGAPVLDPAGNPIPGGERTFTPASGSVAVVYALSREWAVALNAAYTERAPTFQELFSNGPHVATNAFEIGDRDLDKERSAALDLGLRRRGDDWRGAAGAFYNRFSNFVALLASVDPATGQPLFRDTDDRTLPAVADPAGAGYAEPIQQYQYGAVPATFYGLELEGSARVWQGTGQRVDVEVRGDYTRARNRATGAPLPRIAPLRYGGGVIYTRGMLDARLDVLRAEAQRRVPAGELSTDGYTLLDASITYRLRAQGVSGEVYLRAVNLLNEEIRYATSFLRDLAPAGKRGVAIGLRASF